MDLLIYPFHAAVSVRAKRSSILPIKNLLPQCLRLPLPPKKSVQRKEGKKIEAEKYIFGSFYLSPESLFIDPNFPAKPPERTKICSQKKKKKAPIFGNSTSPSPSPNPNSLSSKFIPQQSNASSPHDPLTYGFQLLPLPIASSTIELQSPNPIAHQTLTTEKIPPEEFFNEEEDVDDFDEFDDLPLIVDTGSGAASAGSGIPSAVFNLATSIIGAGIMALPATMKVLGVAVGFASIILMGILSEISIELLVRFSAYCKAASYGEAVQAALGRPSRIASEICIIVNNAGILVVYLIIIGDVMSGSSDHVGVFDQFLGNGPWDHRKLVILVVLVIFLAPLCVLEKIDSLSLTSAASVALAVIFVAVSCIIAIVKLAEGRIRTPRMGPDLGSKAAILDLLVVIPIMTNAYACHFNVQPIYNELKGRTPHKMNRVGRITMVLCVAVYASTAISGYLLFGDDTESDVLTNFDKDLGIKFSSVLNFVVRIGYVLHLVLVFPVIHFSLRQTVDALVFSGSATESRKKMLALTAVLLGIIYLGSTTIPNIWVAFKFTGATTGLSLGFIFPSLIALRLGKQGKNLRLGEKFLSWMMLVLAVVFSIVGVIGNIYSLRSRSE